MTVFAKELRGLCKTKEVLEAYFSLYEGGVQAYFFLAEELL